MAKDAYWFSHDANARHDPKICALISVFGIEGYGKYWIIIEMLREQKNYKLSINNKYGYDVLAMQMQCSKDATVEFINACVNDFIDAEGIGLLQSDEKYIWSNSLNERMQEMETKKQQRIEKAKLAAKVRWDKERELSNA